MKHPVQSKTKLQAKMASTKIRGLQLMTGLGVATTLATILMYAGLTPKLPLYMGE